MYSFPLQIEYSKKRKRSVALKITIEGVVVQAPFYYSEKKIHELVEKRKNWIEKNWTKVQVKKERDTKQFFEGSTLPYLGKRIPLTLRSWTKKSIKFGKNETQFVAYTNKERTQEDFLKYFERWEKSHAIWLLEEKTRVL